MPSRPRTRSGATSTTTTAAAGGAGGGAGDTSPLSTPTRPAVPPSDRDDTPPFEPAVSSGGRPMTRSRVQTRAATVTAAEMKK